MTDVVDETSEGQAVDHGWRVPQTFIDASSFDVREVVQDFVVRDLLGPWDGPEEVLVRGQGPIDPDQRYLVGMLGPRKIDRVDETDSVDLDLGATVSQETDLPEAVNPRMLGKLWVSSMGLTFELACDETAPRKVVVEVDAGRYVSEEGENADGARTRVRRRIPLHWSVEVDLERADLVLGLDRDGDVVERPEQPGIQLRSRVRDHHGRRVVRISLVNAQEPEVTPKFEAWLFQARLTVTALDGAAAIFLPSGHSESPHLTDEAEAHLDLLFRHRPSFAGGHNVAARAEQREGERCAWRLTTEWMPAADVPVVDAPRVPGLETSMERLADLASAEDPTPLLTALQPLVQEYEAWLHRQQDSVLALAAGWHPIAGHAIQAAALIIGRLRHSIGLLEVDPESRRAFAFANRAMRLQRHNTTAALLRDQDPQLGYAEALDRVTTGENGVRNASWRPFQLAFVLLNLPALTMPDHAERTENVDLLFFPTGGGKTEAYLGLAAYTFAVRRLQGVVGSGPLARDGGGGVAVLMRYTLRLLTAQQFQRAAALVCAAEVLRRADPATWGEERFSIGLWVGQSVSPNSYTDAAQGIAAARESGSRSMRTPALQTALCPWCAEPLSGQRDVDTVDATRRIVVFCPRGEGDHACPFSRRHSPAGLPIMTVDEEVYREPPSLLIATVDKLAQLPWYGFAGMLFGRVHARCPRHGYRHPDLDARTGCGVKHAATGPFPAVNTQPVTQLRPPDLIIQDELHLISGALGSTVGLFEAAVDELTSWVTPGGTHTTPKIIASTATTKRAAEQVRELFARELTIFPPQVLDARDTFFSVERVPSREHPGRRYLGLCAHGTRLKAAEIRLAEILLLAGQTALDTYGAAADPYATIVGYFNATRELAGMRRYLDDDVVSRVHRTPWRAGMSSRVGRDLKITELTSRISSAYITDALRQLSVPFDPETRTSARFAGIQAVLRETKRMPEDAQSDRPTDVALATSMLQVGVDVGRLGLMVVTGQPKNIAEYIQASSRVGRERDRPGLVVTLFNWSRPRDLAYYESFAHTHATLYRRVEALSVTPYARRCLDRGTAGTVVAALRNRHELWSVVTAAQDLVLTSDEVRGVVERMLARAERAGGAQARSYLAEKIASFTDRWRLEQQRPNNPIAYRETRIRGVQYSPLLRPAGEGRWEELTVARSMRETENDINLLLPAAPGIFDTVYDAPAWTWPTSRAEPGSDDDRADE